MVDPEKTNYENWAESWDILIGGGMFSPPLFDRTTIGLRALR
jgi:hypothetical protein